MWLKSTLMKIAYYIVSLLCVATAGVSHADETNTAAWGPKVGNLQMFVRLKDGGSEIETNQPIELLVRVKNLSTNKSVVLTEWMGAEIFETTSLSPILTVSGREQHYEIRVDGSFSGTIDPRVAPPNGYYEYEFNIGRLKDPKTKSVYKIVTKRMVGANLVVTSNPLYVKVVPSEWKAPPLPLEFP